MVNYINSIGVQAAAWTAVETQSHTTTQNVTTTQSGDVLDLGAGSVSQSDAMRVVYERAIAKLEAVVSDAQAELGIPEGSVLDTSPEATANRITDFALSFFEQWRANDEARVAMGDEEARALFAEFIGGAIGQGIAEARDILTSLNALSGEIDANIDSTAETIQQRLEDFVLNG